MSINAPSERDRPPRLALPLRIDPNGVTAGVWKKSMRNNTTSPKIAIARAILAAALFCRL
jgi:hypothetical protein